jgi:hypothetical protein
MRPGKFISTETVSSAISDAGAVNAVDRAAPACLKAPVMIPACRWNAFYTGRSGGFGAWNANTATVITPDR